MKNLPIILIVIFVLVLVGGYLIYQKSQVKPVATPVTEPEAMVKKIDLSTQPKWVQDLDVTAKKGKSANGLDNVTVTVKSIPQGLVSGVIYVMQYQTTNKGTQGALSSKPISVTGTTFTKVIDLGTCSTKSCVRHDGVTSVDLELDFTTTSGDTPIWEKTLSLL